MKKIIFAVLAGVILIFTIQFTEYTPVSQFEYDGYVINADKIEQSLNDYENVTSLVRLSPVNALDGIYESRGSNFIGISDREVNLSYPMLYNDNSGIMFLSDKGTLLDENFDVHNVKTNQIVVDGKLYNQFLEGQGDENYLFFVAESGLYENTDKMTVTSYRRSVEIPANSIINFQKEMMTYYYPDGAKMRFASMGYMDPEAKIKIGGVNIGYDRLLKKLGVVQEEIKQEEANAPEKEKEGKEEKAKKPVKNNNNTVTVLPDSNASDIVAGDGTGGDGTGEGGGSGTGGIVIAGYVKPDVQISSYTSTVYSIQSSMTINGPQGNIDKHRVEVQIWNKGKIYMRKYIRYSQQFKIKNLEPGENYTIVTTYKYQDRYGNKITKTFDPIEVKTKPLSNLIDIEYSYTNGEVYDKQIAIKDLTIKTDSQEEAVQNISKMTVEVGDKTYGLRATQISELRTGNSIIFETDKSLKSNTDNIEYTIHAYDSFGNELKGLNNTGTSRTCKQKPEVKLRLEKNVVGYVRLGLDLSNPDDVELDNYRVVAKDIEGNVVLEKNLSDDDSVIEFNSLDAGKILYLQFYADFDLNDDKGYQQNRLLTDTKITTVPLSSLGRFYLISSVKELDDDRAVISYKFEKRTNALLIELLENMTLYLESEDGKEKIILTDEQLSRLKAGETIDIEYISLKSMTDYTLGAKTKVHHGTQDYYDFESVFSMKTIKTLRRDTWIEIRNVVRLEDSISFEARAMDPDEAVVDGFVGMRVKREDQKEMDVIKIDVTKDEASAEGWMEYSYEVPDDEFADRPFSFEFYAVEYNRAYKTSDRISNKIIYTFVEQRANSATGTVGIQEISEGTGNNKRRVDLVYSINDQYDSIKDKKYTFVLYKNDVLEEDLSQSFTMQGRYVTNRERPVTFNLPANNDYRIELSVYNEDMNTVQVLDDVIFDTYYDVDPIRTIEDLYRVSQNPDGHYIVLNDLDITDNPQNIDVEFTGEIDFNGKRIITCVTDDWRYLFKNNKGTLKNAVISTSYLNENRIDSSMMNDDGVPEDFASGFVLNNSGTVSNVMLEFNGTTAIANDGIAGLIYKNTDSGSLTNFVIKAIGPIHTKRNSSYGVVVNNGIIRDGYAYGVPIEAGYANDVVRDLVEENGITYVKNDEEYRKRVGGIAAYNGGKVSNVFSTITINLPGNLHLDNADLDECSAGNIVGLNNGTVSNSYAQGETATQSMAAAFGTAVGRNFKDTTVNKDVYFEADNAHTNPNLNTRITKLQLYDRDFQNNTLNGGTVNPQFDANRFPELGYYPQVAMSPCMPKQELLPLPIVDLSESVAVKSIEVLEYTDDTAEVKLVLKNPGSGAVQQVTVKDIGVTRITSFEHVGKETIVYIKLKDPQKYYSVYSISAVKIKNNYGGSSITKKYNAGEQQIFVDFYRGVDDVNDWTGYVVKNPKENYKLEADLDFKGLSENSIYISDYYGTLDGRGHKISNITMNKNGLIQNLRNGTIKDITFEGVSGKMKSIVYSVPSNTKAVFDHVFVKNFSSKGDGYYMGVINGRADGETEFLYCGVSNATIEPTGNRMFGGITGYLNKGRIKSCYVTSLDMQLNTSNYTYAIGGVVGYMTSGAANQATVEDCYAAGKIEGYGNTIGGLVGYPYNYDTRTIKRCYTDVDISVKSKQAANPPAAGIIGSNTTKDVGNLYVNGDMYNRRSASMMRRYSTGAYNVSKHNVYGAVDQRINGQKNYLAPSETVSGLLKYSDLIRPETLRDTVGLGDAFDYSQVADGILPKLKDEDGSLLPYQKDYDIAGKPEVSELEMDISKVVIAEKNDLGAIIEVYVKHTDGTEVKDIELKDLKIKEKSVIDQGAIQEEPGYKQSVIKLSVAPDKYLDSYDIKSIKAKVGEQTVEKTQQWRIDCIFYKNINNYNDWQTISNDEENYRLTNDIDFTGRGDTMNRNLKVNRFEGARKADGTYPALKNIDIAVDGRAAAANTANVFDAVYESFKYVKVENFSLYVNNPSSYTSTAGFIRYSEGVIEYVDIENMKLCVPKADEETRYCSNVGFLSTGYSWSRPDINYIHVKGAKIYGNNNIGAIAGNTGPQLEQSYGENIEIHAKGNVVGGLTGNAAAYNCTIVNSTIEGKDRVSGIGGNGVNSMVGNVVDGCTITATGNLAGGIATYSHTTYSNIVKNSTIAAAGGGAGGIGADTYSSGSYSIYNNYVIGCTIRCESGPAGGILGTHNFSSNAADKVASVTTTRALRNCGVVNSTIEGGTYAGGIVGNNQGEAYGNFVRNSNIKADQSAGGIVGKQFNYREYRINDNLMESNVTSTSGAAGGIIGEFTNEKNAAGKNLLRIENNIMEGGTVHGSTHAAGLIGKTPEGMLPTDETNRLWTSNLFISGQVISAQHNTALLIGNSVVGGSVEPYYSSIIDTKVHNSFVVGNQSISNINNENYSDLIVDKEDLMKPEFYTALKFRNQYQSNSGTSSWGINNYVTEEKGAYAPIAWMLNYWDAYSGNNSNYTINGSSYRNDSIRVKGRELQASAGLIRLPDDVTTANVMSLRAVSDEIPHLTAYPSDVDKVNVELAYEADSLYYYIGSDENNKQPVTDRVITINYDYSQEITVTVTNGEESSTIELNPAELTRKVMAYGDDYYYIDGGEIISSDNTIDGDFIHLFRGKALKSNGDIVDVTSGNTVGTAGDNTVNDVDKPLQSFDYDGVHVDTYGTHSVVSGQNGESNTREMQMFLKDGNLSLVDGGFNTVKDCIVADFYQDKEYQIILGDDGSIYDMMDEVNLPEDFANMEIIAMASNLDSSGHYLLVQYRNGALAGYDYVTGELLFETEGKAVDFMSFALRTFSLMRTSLVGDDVNKVYGNLEELEEKLYEDPIDETMLMFSSNIAEDADINSGDTADSATVDGVKIVEDSLKETSGNPSAGSQYVAYYDSSNSSYELYSTDMLLDTGKADIESENSRIAASADLTSYYAAPSTKVSVDNNLMGLVILGIIVLIIGGGLTFVAVRKRNG